MNRKLIGLATAGGMLLSTLSSAGVVRTFAAETETSQEASGSTAGAVTNLPQVDMSAWQYDSENDYYWQTGISYCETPADANYETMGFYVPGAYMNGTDNGDGTYTCTINTEGEVAGYTAQSAPVVVPVNTPGYAAMEAPTAADSSCGYGEISDYTGAGFVLAYAGARGKDAGAPAGVTDFKAAIRYTRYNEGVIPGNMDEVFSEGMSGGGAQSAILGASGDSAMYDDYLGAIGAVTGVSDAVTGAMCWCPITNLDEADEAYEWNLGSTRTSLSDEEQTYSDGMASAYAQYINGLGLTDEDGNALTLEESDDGIWQAGSYYDYLMKVVETSLNNFLSDTQFPYTVQQQGFGAMGGGAPTGMGGRPGNGQMPDFGGTEGAAGMSEAAAADGNTAAMTEGTGMPGAASMTEGTGTEGAGTDYSAIDNISRTSSETAAVSLSGTYDTVQDYIDALNEPYTWVTYDADSNTATITSMADFVKALKVASKGIGAFDALDATQGENTLFGYGDGSGAHFDATLASLVAGSDYADAFTQDLAKQDALGHTVDYRVNMYTPLYYLSQSCEGYGTSAVAKYWRIRTGINQSDTALSTEVNLALAAENYSDDTQVDFATVWGLAHTTAERTGDYVDNFISWVNDAVSNG